MVQVGTRMAQVRFFAADRRHCTLGEADSRRRTCREKLTCAKEVTDRRQKVTGLRQKYLNLIVPDLFHIRFTQQSASRGLLGLNSGVHRPQTLQLSV